MHDVRVESDDSCCETMHTGDDPAAGEYSDDGEDIVKASSADESYQHSTHASSSASADNSNNLAKIPFPSVQT